MFPLAINNTCFKHDTSWLQLVVYLRYARRLIVSPISLKSWDLKPFDAVAGFTYMQGQECY